MGIHAFGIELEFTNISTTIAKRALRDAGIEGVEVKTDATPSVTCEIALPPLAPCAFSWQYIRSICNQLEAAGAQINSACGMHCHISNAHITDYTPAAFSRRSIEHRAAFLARAQGPAYFDAYAEPMDIVAVRDIVERYTVAQEQINSMHPRSRTDNRYCTPLTPRLDQIRVARTIRDLQNATYGKFSTVNVTTWSRGTIEFRQAAGTVDADKVIHWVKFLTNLVRYTTEERLDQSATVTTEHTTPERPYRRGSRLDVIWRACRSETGATVRDLMDMTGTSATNIRARISEMRSTHGDDAIVTHTQQAQGASYGDGIDLARYQIRTSWTETQHGAASIRDDALSSIWAGLDDDAFEWWQERIEALAA